jgi:hypothetical protein
MSARFVELMSASAFVKRALLLLLVARLAVAPPMRQAGRSDDVVTGRILHRYCVCARQIRWPQSAVPAGRNDPSVAVAGSRTERGRPPAWMVSAAWPAPSLSFLIRPPSRLLC